MNYAPDEQDALIADALALGGEDFVAELHQQAGEQTAELVPWDGHGTELPGYRTVWLIIARRLIDERRAALALLPLRPHQPDLDPEPRVPGRVPANLATSAGFQWLGDGLLSAADELDEQQLRDYVRALARHLHELARATGTRTDAGDHL